MAARRPARTRPQSVLSRRLAHPVPPETVIRRLDDGAAMVWSAPRRPGGTGFVGLVADARDVVTLDADNRVRDGRGADQGSGLDGFAAVLRARLATSTCDSPLLGWWGQLGYEAGARALGVPFAAPDGPMAAFALVDRGVLIDTTSGALTLVVDAAAADATGWLASAATRLRGGAPGPDLSVPVVGPARRRLGRSDYLEAIDECLQAITRGDAYQLCLTRTIDVELPAGLDPLAVAGRLVRASPAPHAGALRFGDRWLLSASPETYLAVDTAGWARTSPIKGTRPRHVDPVRDRALAVELASDEKERAENVMIVDLCRNDLHEVSALGSVQVSELWAVHSHPHVHQLVSTVESQLVTDALDAALALFPAGSMTGAPKRSAMTLLAGLEQGPRGAYSGIWGRFSSDGSADLAVVIRSIEVRPGAASLGTGGGITILSDPVREWQETELKLAAGLAALGVR